MLTSVVRSRAAGVPRRGAAVLLATVAGGALLAGCGAGQQAQTSSEESSLPGVNANLHGIALRNVQIEYPGRATRTYPREGSAPLEVRIFNSGNDPDALIRVRSDAADQVVLVGSGGEASAVCPQASVSLPAPQPAIRSPRAERPSPTGSPTGTAETSPAEPGGAGEPTRVRPSGSAEFSVELAPGGCALLLPGNPYRLELSGLRQELAPGGTVPVTFGFREAGEVTLQVPLGLPTEGPEHSPLDIRPPESPALGDHDADG